MKPKTNLLLLLTALVVGGCGMLPLSPGHSYFSAGSTKGALQQSQNPKTESTQKYRRVEEAGKTTEEIETVVGSAQKDTAREMAAKLSSLKGVVWVGILVFLFGAASFAWPPLKVLVGGSVTTSLVISVAGLALIVLPSIIVGNEILILCVALGGAVLYWFSHRHGKLQGIVDTLKPKV